MSHFRAMLEMLDRTFPGADYDRWKTQSDMENVRGAERCSPCIDGDHDECWHSPGYDRCSCFLRGHPRES